MGLLVRIDPEHHQGHGFSSPTDATGCRGRQSDFGTPCSCLCRVRPRRGRRRVACPRRVSLLVTTGCLRAIPPTPPARYLTEQHAEHSQQVGCLAASSQTSAKSTPSSSALLTLSRTLVLGRTAVVVRITWGADVDAARLNSKWREHLSRSPAIWPAGRFAAGAGSPGCGSALFFTSPAPPAEPGGAGGSCG